MTVVEVPLSRGLVAVLDEQDWPKVADLTWYAHEPRPGEAYAAHRSSKPRTIVRMHRLILGVTDPDLLVDHRDGDRLNNRRANLRVATVAQNNRNRGQLRTGTSPYKGVTRRGARWSAGIWADGRSLYLGTFDSAELAAEAYNAAAVRLHGDFARLNVLPTLALTQVS